MKCPNCGIYLEDDRDTCFMCGEKINNTNASSNDFNSNSDFSSNVNSDFSPTPNYDDDYMVKKEAYQNRFKDYRQIGEEDLNGGKQDIFDFFAKHKKPIKIFSLCLLVILVILIAVLIIKHNNDSKKEKGVLNELYYKLDDSFKLETDNSSQKKYVKVINGNQCIITVDMVKDSSETHSDSFFNDMKKNLAPRRDKDGKENPLEQFDAKNSKKVINGINWNFLNMYYRADTEGKFTVLKYKYLSSTYNGYSYDIALINEKNNETCNIDLDNFVKTLKYIEKE